jgi:hypothetical protein
MMRDFDTRKLKSNHLERKKNYVHLCVSMLRCVHSASPVRRMMTQRSLKDDDPEDSSEHDPEKSKEEDGFNQ